MKCSRKCTGLLVAFVLAFVMLSFAQAAAPSNPNASAGARTVLDYLAGLSKQATNSLIVGQHIGFTTSRYTNFTDYVPLGYQTFVTPLQQKTGKWLGLVGADFSTSDPTFSYPLDYSNVTPTLIDHWRKGGLVTVMYSARNPWTWKNVNDRSVMVPMADIVTAGTAANANWLTQLDSVAAGLKTLRDAGVVVLFRPLHEINGSWFWYAHNPANPTNTQDTIALWRFTHDYLTKTKGLDNLLWVYAASTGNGSGVSDELAFYPGAEYVDIVGIDIYARTIGSADIAGFAKLRATGKPICLCEIGPTNQASDGSFDYQAFVANEVRAKVPDIAYMMSWADYPSGTGKANIALVSNRNADLLLNEPWTATADEVQASLAALKNYSDSWWNANESGWGLNITDHGSNLFVQWYTYDQSGHNQKYVVPGGILSADKCLFSGTLQHVSGPAWTLAAFDPNQVVRRTAGTATIDFCPVGLPAGTIVFAYTADGISGSKLVTRLSFGNDVPHQGGAANTGGADYTDLWWNPNESGWGVSITQHGNNVFARIYAYDTDNRPLLFVIPGVTFANPGAFSGPVQLTTGPWFGSNPFDPNQVVRTAAGTASFTFSDPSNGVLTYTINGITKTKPITRLTF